MAAFVSLLAASAVRVASLNLCSDEYLVLLAKPGEIASVTTLAHDPAETGLASAVRRVPANRGKIEDVIGVDPSVVITMGGGGRSSGAIARALGLKVVDLPQPGTVDDVAANLKRVGLLLDDPHRADPWLSRLSRLRHLPGPKREAIWLSGGGTSLSPGSLGAQWLALAGFEQRPLTGGRATIETLVTAPPAYLVISNYRSGEMSSGQQWLRHPLLHTLPSRTLTTDGRAWTCGGPMMIAEIERLRHAVR